MMANIYYLTFSEDTDWAVKEGINQYLLVTALESLRAHSDAHIFLLLPKTPLSNMTYYTLQTLGVEFMMCETKQWDHRRMLCRLEQFGHLLKFQHDGSHLISGEVDEIFLSNPFEFFREDFDVGLAKRNSGNEKPVNAGLTFFRKSDKVVKFYDWVVSQIATPTWEVYHRHRHRKNTHDVYCDVDLWLAVWRGRKYIEDTFGIKVELIDCGYLMDEAIAKGQCSFHLKGNSKCRIYEPNFSKRISNG